MNVKEFVLYLFKVIPIFKWQVKEFYIPTSEEKDNLEQQRKAQEVINELMQTWNPQGYEEYKIDQDLEDIKNISNGGGN
jgi:hypothetical protein